MLQYLFYLKYEIEYFIADHIFILLYSNIYILRFYFHFYLKFVLKIVLLMESQRSAVIELFQSGHKKSEILKRLKMSKGRRMFVHRTIKRFQDTGKVKDRNKSGRPVSVTTPNVRKAVREQIRRNPRRSMRKMASVLNISRKSVQRIVRKDLGMKSFKRKKVFLPHSAS